MPLNKDVLGVDLYERVQQFNNVQIPPEQMEAVRLNFWKEVAEGVLNHIITNGVVSVNVEVSVEVDTTGTATAQSGGGDGTGTGTGTIS